MTETVVTEEAADVVDVEEEQAAGPEVVNCRHCGQPHELAPDADADWLCPSCERYQDSMICSTCNSVVRISLMPKGSAPEPHAPVRSRKAKGES